MLLAGKTAAISGAASPRGIGLATARLFAKHGARVAILDLDDAGAQRAAKELGQGHVGIDCDVANLESCKRAAQQAIEAFGQLDILVNNAGMGIHGEVAELPFESWERVIRTNLHGPFLCSQQAARRMLARDKGGRMIHITSVHEESCWPGAAGYCASKSGLRNLMRTLAIELGPHGITSNGIAPGMILTPMNKRAANDPEYLRNAEEQIVVRRAGRPSDIAQMALYLASDAASYCTGATYYVDGGWMLTWPPV